MKVLLVDDDSIFNFLHSKLLAYGRLSQEVHVTLNGRQAIDFLNSTGKDLFPDIILLDLAMPVMDGFDFVRDFRKVNDWQHIRIVVITSSDNPDDLRKIGRLGIDTVLKKPVSLEKLQAILKQ